MDDPELSADAFRWTPDLDDEHDDPGDRDGIVVAPDGHTELT